MSFEEIVRLITDNATTIVILAYFVYKDITINKDMIKAIEKFTETIELIKELKKGD